MILRPQYVEYRYINCNNSSLGLSIFKVHSLKTSLWVSDDMDTIHFNTIPLVDVVDQFEVKPNDDYLPKSLIIENEKIS